MQSGPKDLDYQEIFNFSSFSIALATEDKQICFTNSNFLKTLEINSFEGKTIDDLFDLTDEQSQKLGSLSQPEQSLQEEVLCKHENGEFSSLLTIIKKIQFKNSPESYYLFEIPSASSTEGTEFTQRIGQTISQISHDLSNPLSIVKIHCDSFALIAGKEPTLPTDEVLKRIAKLSDATTRVVDITNKLKSFAKKLISSDIEEIRQLWEKEDEAKEEA